MSHMDNVITNKKYAHSLIKLQNTHTYYMHNIEQNINIP